MPASVEASAAMEAATSTTMKAAAPAAVIAATCMAATVAASDIAAGASSVSIPRPVAIAGPIAISPAVVAVARASIEAAAVVTVIPRTGTDKEAIYKVTWPVIAIGCASVGIVAVISIGAYRSGADARVDGTNADGNLSLRASRGEKQNSEQCCIF